MSASNYIKTSLNDAVIENSSNSGEEIIWIHAKHLRDVVKILKLELCFDILLDVISIDWFVQKKERFQLDYLFYNTKENSRVHLKATLTDNDNPTIDSIFDIYGSADWAERECYDMMGIHFKKHPHLKRLLMWTEFKGHPLRKDYKIDHRQPIPVLDKLL